MPRVCTLLICVLVVALSRAAAQAQDCDGWWAIGDPAPRTGHAMAYDSQRAVIVLFGGMADPINTFPEHAMGQTWEFDGSRWYFRGLTGPGPRTGHAMAYDSDRHVTVLYGGKLGSTYLGDTWEWDGQVWTQRTPGGQSPGVRSGAGMCYDPIRHQILLYGNDGCCSGRDSMWTYDGSNWTQVVQGPQWPQSAYALSLSWDPVGQRVLLIGGWAGPCATLAWDGSAWSRVTGCPALVNAPGMTFDPVRNQVIATSREGSFGATAALTPQGWVQIAPLLNSVNPGVMTCHEASGRVIMLSSPFYGGNQYTTDGLYELHDPGTPNGAGWQVFGVPSPTNSSDPAMAFDSRRGVCVLHGGQNKAQFTLVAGDTWELRGETWTRRLVAGVPRVVQPSPRYGAAMAYDPVRGVCIMNGGSVQDANTWEWDGQHWTTHSAGGATAANNNGCIMVWDSVNQGALLSNRGGSI